MPSKKAIPQKEPDDDAASFVLHTLRDYPLDEVMSDLQKCVRRGREREAVFIVRELVDSGFVRYLWRRLMIVASEECSNDIALCAHIGQLAKNAELATSGFTKLRNSIIETQAVIALCRAAKSREACDATCAICYMMKSGFRIKLHPASVDKHTKRGKEMGKSVVDFKNEGRYVAGEQDATKDPMVRNDWESVLWGTKQPHVGRPGEEGGEDDIELPELVWDESKPNADPFVPEGELDADGSVKKQGPAGRQEAGR
jgi:hypothetical protein